MLEIAHTISNFLKGKDRLYIPSSGEVERFIRGNIGFNPHPPFDAQRFLERQNTTQLTASDVATYGIINWNHILNTRTDYPGGVPTYIEELIRIMMNESKYRKRVKDTIDINQHWESVFGGKHRLFALRILGPQTVENSGMNDWVNVQLVG